MIAQMNVVFNALMFLLGFIFVFTCYIDTITHEHSKINYVENIRITLWTGILALIPMISVILIIN